VWRGSLTENSGTTSLPVSSPGRTIDLIEIMPASPAGQITKCRGALYVCIRTKSPRICSCPVICQFSALMHLIGCLPTVSVLTNSGRIGPTSCPADTEVL
jgi:hypothetical protein